MAVAKKPKAVSWVVNDSEEWKLQEHLVLCDTSATEVCRTEEIRSMTAGTLQATAEDPIHNERVPAYACNAT